jgi:seryl-tRNA synthetase
MIEIAYLRAQPAEIKERLKVKNFKDIHLVDEIVSIDAERRNIQKKLDDILAQSNELSARIGVLYKEGKREEADELKKETTSYKEETTLLKNQLDTLEKSQEQIAVQLPNIPHSSVPLGKTPEENIVIKEFGSIPTLYAGAKPHWDIAVEKELFDLELGVKITGAGFPVYKGKGARLQRALINFFLDGENPAYVDMPIWYTHNIKNIGTEDLYTIFWINEPYNQDDPDTYIEVV